METSNYLPPGYNAVMPYIIIEGAEKFMDFTKQVFDATEKHKEMADEHTIRHAEVNINGSIIMCADSIPDYPPQPASLFVYVANADETYKKALDAGATSLMEPMDKEYGRSCGVKDLCGNTWWITSVK